jgi:hypothetical protein
METEDLGGFLFFLFGVFQEVHNFIPGIIQLDWVLKRFLAEFNLVASGTH